MADTYKCAMCGNEYEFEVPKNAAVAEMKELWGEKCTVEQCDIVCDDCFQKIHPSKNPELTKIIRQIIAWG